MDILKSMLFQRRAGLISMLDLDAYDSELAQDLLSLHDEIAMNPVRGYMPDYQSGYAQKRVWNFTWNALQNRLAPAIKAAVPKLGKEAASKVQGLLEQALGKMTLAQSTLDRTQDYGQGGKHLEAGFSLLHDAIEAIRDATRRTPAVRNVRPPVPQAYRDFS